MIHSSSLDSGTVRGRSRRTLLAAFALFAIVAAAFAGISMASEDSDAALGTYTATTSSSTVDDPYTGVGGTVASYTPNQTIHVRVGSSVDIKGAFDEDGDDSIKNTIKSVTSGFGLTLDPAYEDLGQQVGRVTGTISKVGSITLAWEYYDTTQGKKDFSTTIVGVNSSAASRTWGSAASPVSSFSQPVTQIADATHYLYIYEGSSFALTATSDQSGILSDRDASSHGITQKLNGPNPGYSGTVTTPGTFTISAGAPVDGTLLITVVAKTPQPSEPTINFTSPAAVDTVSGSSVRYQATTNITGTTFKATGTGNASWLTVTSAGVLSGTAPSVTSKTTASYSILATSPGGQTATQKVTFTVYPVAKITPNMTTMDLTVGRSPPAFSVSCNLPCTYTVQQTTGTLAELGMSYNVGKVLATGVPFVNIQGTPTKAGTAVLKIIGNTTEGPTQTPSVVITVNVAAGDIEITSSPPTGIYKVGNSYTYSAKANQTVTWALGDNPSWLSVDANTGKVSGQVTGYTAPTTITYTLKAVSGSKYAEQRVNISIEPTLEFTSVPTAACTVVPVFEYADDGTPSVKNSLLVDYDEPTFSPAVLGSRVLMDGSASDVSGSGSSNPDVTAPGTRTYRFTWTGEDAESVHWEFGDGGSADGFSVVHTYKENGTYTYTCTGTNSQGSSSVTGRIVVDMDEEKVYTMWIVAAIILLFLILVAYRLGRRKAVRTRTVSAGRSRAPRSRSRSSSRGGSRRSR